MGEIAGRQHGVVADWQLIAVGLSTSAISRRVASGRLYRVHRGVYAVGHEGLSMEATWTAAILACGKPGRARPDGRPDAAGEGYDERGDARPTKTILAHWGAALSHRSAACHWGLSTQEEGPVDISIQGDGGRRRRRGIRLHRSLTLLPADVTLRNGIPVTTPARTIADLRRAISASGRRGLISPRELRRVIRQANVLGLPIGAETGRDRTRSDLERDFLRLCRRYRLPPPEVNVRIGRHRVDFLWRERMLVVETDGYLYHRGRAAFEDDRATDLALRARGYEVIRLAEKQVDDDAGRVAEVVSAALRVGADASEREGKSGE